MSTLSRLFLCTFILGTVAMHHTSQGGENAVVPFIITIATAFFFVVMGAVDDATRRGNEQ